MPTQITTSTAATATAYSNQRKIDRTSNGVLWAFLPVDTGTNYVLCGWYSLDSGATWTKDPTGNITTGSASATATYATNFSVFIDVDDYAHVVYKDRSNGYIYYHRGTPNAARTRWTWSAATLLDSTTTAWNYPNVVAHREGTGWVAHIVYSHTTSTGSARTTYTRVAVTSAGTASIATSGSIATAAATAGASYPSIDFHHTGDGKTVAGGTPHLYAAWSHATTGAGQGIRFRKATYSAGSWTWGTEREIDSTRFVSTANYWVNCLFDGTRVLMPGLLYDGTNSDLILYERDVADTTTTTRVLADNQAAGSLVMMGSASYDAAGNVYLIGLPSAQTSVAYYVWNRATATLGARTVVDSTGTHLHVSAKRDGSAGRVEWIYAEGTASPYAVNYDSLSLNVAPNAPTLTAPASNAVLNRAVAQTVTWTPSDPNPGDTQSAYVGRYRLVGAASWTAFSGTTPTPSHTFAANHFAVGNYEWQVATRDAQGTPALDADLVYSASSFFTVANAPTAPTITAPTSGGTVNSTPSTVAWSYPTQDAYQVRTVADNAGSPNTATVYTDTGEITDAGTRARSVVFAVTGRYEHVQVRVKDDLWSPWASVRVNVAYTAPTQPTHNLTTTAAGHVLVQVNNPPATGTQPAVQHHDIYSRCAASNPTADPNRPYSDVGTRVATGVPPAGSWTDGWVAKNVEYEYRAVSVGTTGTTASGTWSG